MKKNKLRVLGFLPGSKLKSLHPFFFRIHLPQVLNWTKIPLRILQHAVPRVVNLTDNKLWLNAYLPLRSFFFLLSQSLSYTCMLVMLNLDKVSRHENNFKISFTLCSSTETVLKESNGQPTGNILDIFIARIYILIYLKIIWKKEVNSNNKNWVLSF